MGGLGPWLHLLGEPGWCSSHGTILWPCVCCLRRPSTVVGFPSPRPAVLRCSCWRLSCALHELRRGKFSLKTGIVCGIIFIPSSFSALVCMCTLFLLSIVPCFSRRFVLRIGGRGIERLGILSSLPAKEVTILQFLVRGFLTIMCFAILQCGILLDFQKC